MHDFCVAPGSNKQAMLYLAVLKPCVHMQDRRRASSALGRAEFREGWLVGGAAPSAGGTPTVDAGTVC